MHRQLYRPFVTFHHSGTRRKPNGIVAIAEFVTERLKDDAVGDLTDFSSPTKERVSYLLTASEADLNIKQWVRYGSVFKCINTFSGGKQEITSLAQLNEEVFVGMCPTVHIFSARANSVKFWCINKPPKPIHVINDAACMAILRRCKNTVAVGSAHCVTLFSISGSSTHLIRTLHTTDLVEKLCEMDDGVLVSLTTNGEIRWWNVEIGSRLRVFNYSRRSPRNSYQMIGVDNRLIIWASRLEECRIISCDKVNEAGEPHSMIFVPMSGATSATRLKSGGFVASTDDRITRIFDSELKEMASCGYHMADKALSVCEMSDGSIACGTEKGTIAIWVVTPPK